MSQCLYVLCVCVCVCCVCVYVCVYDVRVCGLQMWCWHVVEQDLGPLVGENGRWWSVDGRGVDDTFGWVVDVVVDLGGVQGVEDALDG